ncbi:MAG: hypothetical protein ACRD3J_17395 [Thermoanaerobaculia bacterium]
MRYQCAVIVSLVTATVAPPIFATVDIDKDSALVCSASTLNFLEPDATLIVENPSGTAEMHMEKYALLDGRAGGQTLFGGLSSGDNLVLVPNAAGNGSGAIGVFDATQAQWSLNGFNQPRLILGGETDPSMVYQAGGLIQFLVENDSGNNNAIAGLFTASNSNDAPAQIAGIRARGSCTSPVGIQAGDNIFDLLAMAYDATNTLQVVGVLDWTADDTPGSGYVPSKLALNVMGPDANFHPLVVTPYGPIRLEHTADANAEGDTWYFSSDSSKAVYKDSGGDVHPLYGLPTNTDSRSLTVQSADIGAMDLADTGPGLYRLSYYVVDTAADATAGTISLGVDFADDSGSQTISAGPVSLSTLGIKAQGDTTIQLASGHIAFSISHSGTFGMAAYSLYLALERVA